MSPTESASAFEAFALAAGVPLLTSDPQSGFSQMLDFYSTVPALGCAGESNDMLLFQWGIYDWGNGAAYEVDLTRQFIESSMQHDDAISQLRLTFYFSPSPALEALDNGNRWCENRESLAEFRRFVLASPYLALTLASPQRVKVGHGYV